MKKNKILIASILLLVVALTVSLAVVTYAVWTEQAYDTIELGVPTNTFNPSLKYIIFQGLDDEGNFVESGIKSYAVVGYSGIIGELVIPETYQGLPVTRISASATQTNTNLAGNQVVTSIVIPNSVKTIDAGVCANMYYLKSVTIDGEDNEISIGAASFAGCIRLSTFTCKKSINGDRGSFLLNTPAL